MNLLGLRAKLQYVAGYVLAALVSISILVWVQRLWKADLSVPFTYLGDAVFTQTFIKGVLDNGWYLHNNYIGMPYGSDLHDYPMVDSLHFGVIKLLSFIRPEHALLFNLYYLLTYPLTALFSLLVFRRFGLSYGLALAGSILFAFLPYHFWRGQVHLLLASYYLIPLMVLLQLWLCTGGAVFFGWDEQRERAFVRLLRLRAFAAMAICALIACGGIYYAFFGCFLLAVAGIYSYLTHKKTYSLWNAGCCIAIIAFVVCLHLAPTFFYRWEHGTNPQAMQRLRSDPETFALKIVQLLLPATGHRLPLLAFIKGKYNAHFAVTDNDSAALGFLGSIGFLLLIGRLLYRRPSPEGPRLEDSLSVLNVFAILLGTMGGLGSFFSLAIGPHIRGYSRISVYIAFFSIFALLLCLEKLKQRLPRTRAAGFLCHALPIILLALGILDQTNRSQIPLYARVKEEYQNDAEFVQRIEASLARDAMVFQLPYSPFPEGLLCTHQMFVYDPARAYLHSKTLRWSYGAIRGREADLWQQQVASLPAETFLEALVKKGFAGLYIDRNAYPDHGASLEAQFSNLLNAQPLVSANQRLAFFNVRHYTKRQLPSSFPNRRMSKDQSRTTKE